MIDGKRVLALVPARSGSVGVPGKNISNLGDESLLERAVRAATSAAVFDDVVVSTDAPLYRDIALRAGAQVPFLRPAGLADSYTASVDVALHALNVLQSLDFSSYEYLFLVEPTSPFRRFSDLGTMVMELDERRGSADAIVSVMELSFDPSLIFTVQEGMVGPLLSDRGLVARRQDKQEAFVLCGIGYGIKVTTLLREKTFVPMRTLAFPVESYQGIEIDSAVDFALAQALHEVFDKDEFFNSK